MTDILVTTVKNEILYSSSLVPVNLDSTKLEVIFNPLNSPVALTTTKMEVMGGGLNDVNLSSVKVEVIYPYELTIHKRSIVFVNNSP